MSRIPDRPLRRLRRLAFLTAYHHAADAQVRRHALLRPWASSSSIVGTLNFNLVAAFKIQGASCGFSSACASSAHALGFAFDELALGRQKRMFVVGGEDGNMDAILPFAGMRTLSLQTDPEIASRPFDAARDGFVGTGGGTVLVLETEAEVARRAVNPYAEVLGWGQASDGYNVAISHPEGSGSKAAMQNALSQCQLGPEAVDYVNAHATSTVIGDISEARALRAVFPDASSRPLVSSTKALTGHGLSLAGAMECGFCALAMREGFVPGLGPYQPRRPGLRGPEHSARDPGGRARSRAEEQQRLRRGQRRHRCSGGSEPSMARRLCESHRTALVTGASSGLGRAFADMLAAEGVRVWGTARGATGWRALGAPSGPDLPGRSWTWRTRPAAEAAFRAAAAEAGGAFDLVVNNAGYGVFGEFAAVETAVWEAQLAAMLGATLRLTHAGLAGMRPHGAAGLLVNVSSLAAEFPLPLHERLQCGQGGPLGPERKFDL